MKWNIPLGSFPYTSFVSVLLKIPWFAESYMNNGKTQLLLSSRGGRPMNKLIAYNSLILAVRIVLRLRLLTTSRTNKRRKGWFVYIINQITDLLNES